MAKGNGGTRAGSSNNASGVGAVQQKKLQPLKLHQISYAQDVIKRKIVTQSAIEGEGIKYIINTKKSGNSNMAIVSYREDGSTNVRFLNDVFASSKKELSEKVIEKIKEHYKNR